MTLSFASKSLPVDYFSKQHIFHDFTNRHLHDNDVYSTLVTKVLINIAINSDTLQKSIEMVGTKTLSL